MKSVKNFFKNTLSSTMVIMIVASMMVVASVAASQNLFTELLIDNDGSYCTMTYDGTPETQWYTEHPDNEFSERNWRSLSQADAYYQWDVYYPVHTFTHEGRIYNYCYYYGGGGACYFYIPR